MLSELPTQYRPAAFMVNQVASPWEQQAALALRRAVFCMEQGIFIKDDRDQLDDHAITLVALSCVAGQVDDVVGTVRLHRGLDPNEATAPSEVRDDAETSHQTAQLAASDEVYWGSRLAVHPGARGAGLIGTSLIRRAVRSAVTLGAQRFFAHVQLQNVPLFEALHWTSLHIVVLHGRRHALMQADLNYYPPLADMNATELIFAKALA